MLFRSMRPIETIFTFTELSTAESRIIALTILLLTLGFPTITMFSIGSIDRGEGISMLILGNFLGFLHRVWLLITIRAITTIALISAYFTWWKTLTVHLKTTSLLAVATSAFFDDWSSNWYMDMLPNTDMRSWTNLYIGAAYWSVLFVWLLFCFLNVVINLEFIVDFKLFLDGMKPFSEV